MKLVIRTISIGVFLISILSVHAQIDTIHLEKNRMNGYSQLKVTTDSIHIDNDFSTRYYSTSAIKIVPHMSGLDSILLAFQFWQDGSIKVCQLGIENAAFETFDSSKSYYLSITKNQEHQFQVEVSLQFLNDGLFVACYNLLVGKLPFQDTSIYCHIRPFISNRNPIQFSRDGKRTYNSDDSYQFGENFTINNQFFQLNFIDLANRTILLQQIPDSMGQFGYKEGFTISEYESFQSKMYSSKNTFQYHGTKEFSMFYIWGEWCAPCIRKIPKNIELYNKLDTTKIEVTNIALCTDKKSINKTKRIVDANDIPGNHFLELSSDKPFINQLNVNLYPTRLLVDSKGKILFRSDGGKDLGLEEILEELQLLSG